MSDALDLDAEALRREFTRWRGWPEVNRDTHATMYYDVTAMFGEITRLRTLVPQLVARVRALEAGPDDAACDDIIEAVETYMYYSHPENENRTIEARAAIRAALKGE